MRRHVTSLLVLLLALRCLVPVGFMLAPVGEGGVSIVVCTGSGPQLLQIDEDGKPVKHDKQATAHGLCAFAPVGASVASSDAPTLLSAPAVYQAFAYVHLEDRREPQDWSGAYLARGPPVNLA